MLLKKECGRQLSALSLCLAVMFAPLLTAQADEPEIVPTDSSAATGAQPTSLSQPLEQSPATAVMAGIKPLPEGIDIESLSQQLLSGLPSGYTPAYINQLTLLYAARDMKPMWEDRDAVRAFQQQLAEVAIAGFQPQFTKWVELLTDPAVTGQARDVVLSDAMMGYLQFVAGAAVKKQRLVRLYQRGGQARGFAFLFHQTRFLIAYQIMAGATRLKHNVPAQQYHGSAVAVQITTNGHL